MSENSGVASPPIDTTAAKSGPEGAVGELVARLAEELQKRSVFLEAWSRDPRVQNEELLTGKWRKAVLEGIRAANFGADEKMFAEAERGAFLASLRTGNEVGPSSEADPQARVRQLVDSFHRQHLVYYFVAESNAPPRATEFKEDDW